MDFSWMFPFPFGLISQLCQMLNLDSYQQDETYWWTVSGIKHGVHLDPVCLPAEFGFGCSLFLKELPCPDAFTWPVYSCVQHLDCSLCPTPKKRNLTSNAVSPGQHRVCVFITGTGAGSAGKGTCSTSLQVWVQILLSAVAAHLLSWDSRRIPGSQRTSSLACAMVKRPWIKQDGSLIPKGCLLNL